MKNVAFWVKWHSFLDLNLWQCGVFSVTKVCVFFTNGVYRKLFTMFFITTICVYDFCETLLLKINTPCQGMIWIFPSKMLYFSTGLLMVLHKLNCEPWNAKKANIEGAALKHLPGLMRPGCANQCSTKMSSLPALFCCTYFPGSVLHWHCLL